VTILARWISMGMLVEVGKGQGEGGDAYLCGCSGSVEAETAHGRHPRPAVARGHVIRVLAFDLSR